MKTFGDMVRDARKARGWTMDRLARAIKSHKGYVHGIEHGDVNPPSAKLVLKLAKSLDLEPDHLLALGFLQKRPKGLTIRSIFNTCAELLEQEAKAAAEAAQASSAVPQAAGSEA